MWRWFTVELPIRTSMARCSLDNTCKWAMLISRSVTWSQFRHFRPLLAVWMEYPMYRRMWLILFNNNIIHIYMLRWLLISVDGVMHYRLWYKFSVLLASWSTCFSTFNNIMYCMKIYRRCRGARYRVRLYRILSSLGFHVISFDYRGLSK